LNTTQTHHGAQAAGFTRPLPDKAVMAKALSALFGPNDIVELRAFPKGKNIVVAGYFDAEHMAALMEHAFQLNKAGALCYITMNPIDPQLLGRYRNRIEDRKVSTAVDKDVIRRRWLLLDFDPKRPKDTAATDAQLEAAHESCRACEEHLASLGWPAPIKCCSGNGFHLYYPIDLPNDSESTDLIKGVLATVAERFGTNAVEVDQTVSNAARITKLCGTVSTKGDHTPGMPWRLSQLLEAPGRDAIVTVQQLKALQPAHKGNGADTGGGGTAFLDGFLARLESATTITCYSRDMHNGAERYHLSRCPFNSDHGRGKAVVLKLAAGALTFKCQESSCENRKWKDLRDLVDGPKSARGDRAEGDGEVEILWRCMADIEEKPIRWLWRGRIPRGKITLFAGNPDLGKSQVTASIAAITTIGGLWPVDRSRCEQGKVIILNAEDEAEDTIRPRLRAAGADLTRIFILDAIREHNGTKRLFNLTADIGRLGDLAKTLEGVALIVIDPITAYLGRTDSHKNAEVRAVLAPLAAMAAERGAGIICVSHFSKAGATEALLRVMGSLAFTAAGRSGYMVAKDPEDETRRLFLPLKNNIAEPRPGLAFRIKGRDLGDGIETSCVEWDAEPVNMTADEAMAPPEEPEARSMLAEAADWLSELLKDRPAEVKAIEKGAKAAGHAWPTVKRAKGRLGVTSGKRAMAAGWWWFRHGSPEWDQLARARAGGEITGVDPLRAPTPLKANVGAGSTEGDQGLEKTAHPTPLKANAGAGSTEGDQGFDPLRDPLREEDHERKVPAPGALPFVAPDIPLYTHVVITLGAGTKERRSFESNEAPGGMTLEAWRARVTAAHGPSATVRPVGDD
jgi:hypothetical protein